MFDVLPVSLNQSSFFTFFESSIMRKIEPGSRLECRACCVSGMALSEGGLVLNARLVYFVSEQVFPSGAYFKSALPPYLKTLVKVKVKGSRSSSSLQPPAPAPAARSAFGI